MLNIKHVEYQHFSESVFDVCQILAMKKILGQERDPVMARYNYHPQAQMCHGFVCIP